MLRKKSQVKINRSYRTKKLTAEHSDTSYLLHVSMAASILLLTFINITLVLHKSLIKPEPVLAQTTSIEDEKLFWVDFLSKHPDYLPGILELVKIEYQMGDFDSADILIGKAKIVNPNDDALQRLLQELKR